MNKKLFSIVFIFLAFGLGNIFVSCGEFKEVDFVTKEDLERQAAQQSSSSSASAVISKEGISGVSQKGPFVQGTDIILWELDSNLVQTGKSFNATTDGGGNFEIRGIELVSPYVRIRADGFYRNEVSGSETKGQKITLYAIADVSSKSGVNVNILTHLEHLRVEKLAGEGKSFSDAKSQAQGEILAVFSIDADLLGSDDLSIFGSSDGSAALLAISILLQGNRSVQELSELLDDISRSIESSGSYESAALKSDFSSWASSVDLSAIRSNILGWGLGNVPAFEKYIEVYISSSSVLCGSIPYNPATHFCYANDNKVYELCGVSKQEYDVATQKCEAGIVETRCGANYYNAATHFCQGGNTITLLCDGETYTANQFCAPEDSKVYGRCSGDTYNPLLLGCCNNATYSLATHFCHGNNIEGRCGGDGDTYVPETELCCGKSKYVIATQFCYNQAQIMDKCGDVDYDPNTQFCHSDNIFNKCSGDDYDPDTQLCDSNNIFSKCGENSYDPDTKGCCDNIIYELDTQMCGAGLCGIFDKTREHYDKPKSQFCDERDGKKYVSVTIGDQTWMAENLNYNAPGSKCGNGISLVDNNTPICETYGRLYNWATAVDLPSSCNSSNCSAQIQSKRQGVCPEGWYLPSDTEWSELISSAGNSSAGTNLKATTSLWYENHGKDEFGFSALPGGIGGSSILNNVELMGHWWSATVTNDNNASSKEMYWAGSSVTQDNRDKSSLLSVRCVKDDD